jgi:hypothetical protein
LHFQNISSGFHETIDKFHTNLPAFKGTESRDIFEFFLLAWKIYGGQIRNAPDCETFQEILLHISVTVFFSLRLMRGKGVSNWDQASNAADIGGDSGFFSI